MRFVIRDDDLNYFSTDDEVRRWCGDLFARHIPVGFSTIPFVKPQGDKFPMRNLPNSDKEYAIGGNRALVDYICSVPYAEILQHGTTHETVGGIYEYARSISASETERGRQELERAFGRKVRVFVPPHDWINSSGVRAVEAAHMDIIRGRGAGLRNWIPRWQYVTIFFRMLAWKLSFTLRRTRVPAYPYVLDFGKHKELCSYRLEDEDVFEGLAYAHRKNGIFVVVTHLHFYTDDKKARLLELIKKASEYGAEFVPPSAVFHG